MLDAIQFPNARKPPHNFEAEQAVLGAILISPKAWERVESILKPEDFADPYHGRLYEACGKLIKAGQRATPVTINPLLQDDPDYPKLLGAEYLARLAGAAVTVVSVTDFAHHVRDMALRRALISFGEDAVAAGFDYGAGAEVGSMFSTLATQLDQMARASNQDGLRTVSSYAQAVEDLYDGVGEKPLSTGFGVLDDLYKVRAGEVTVVTGWPGSGKSLLIDAISVNMVTKHGWKFAMKSFEKPGERHVSNLLEMYVGARFHEGPTERMSRGEMRAGMDWLDQNYVFIDTARESPTVDLVLAKARLAVDDHGINGLILDPYNRFEHRRPQSMSETEYIAQMLDKVFRFATDNHVHVWFIAHPAKPFQGQSDEAPGLMQISGSQHWVNFADVGLSAHRQWNADGKTRSNQIEVHIKKMRWQECGRVGMATLEYINQTGRFTEFMSPKSNGRWG